MPKTAQSLRFDWSNLDEAPILNSKEEIFNPNSQWLQKRKNVRFGYLCVCGQNVQNLWIKPPVVEMGILIIAYELLMHRHSKCGTVEILTNLFNIGMYREDLQTLTRCLIYEKWCESQPPSLTLLLFLLFYLNLKTKLQKSSIEYIDNMRKTLVVCGSALQD